MAEPLEQQSLGERLRSLRVERRDGVLTQARLAAALGISTGLISSWESGTAIPPAERLRDYALAFASDRTFAGPEPSLLDESDLTQAEDRRRQDLIDELGRLRDRAMRPDDASAPGTGALGGRFWYYPGGAPVRIISTPAWAALEKAIPYTSPWHPNYVESFHDMDRDATIELFGHIRAENPTADVRFLTADRVSQDDLTGHVVLLGQADQMFWAQRKPNAMTYFVRRLELPVGTRLPEDGDAEFDAEFVVTTNAEGAPTWYPPGDVPAREVAYRPRFLRDVDKPGRPARLRENGFPLLEYDVALLARKKNELNLSTTVTICSGIFSRGTYGSVRALTDANLRTRNERFLTEQIGGLSDFWMLFYVPVYRGMLGLETVTPDLERPFHRLRSSA